MLLELAGQIAVPDLTAVIDAIIGHWNGPPETDLTTLTRAIDAAGRFVGSARLQQALRSARPDVDSPQETRLRLTIVDAGLPEPVVHPPISADGVVLHPDLAYLDEMIAIEYEGDEHRSDPERWARDIERYDALTELGWTVIRVTRRSSIPKFIERLRMLLSGSPSVG
ncbi:endonuclease domain-containing protein [Brevibacterium daeguense]|uniref:endonuclease domain-containing protein n=1 Tax=Brevibacterium daeguense TaxID=909936 RepID=UPI001F288592|nr:hypothetical protein [Brevibacterium daeguense]